MLAPKGGCGKTYVASLIAQALLERGEPVICFDTDRENASLRDIPALKAEPVSLFLPNSDEIDVNAMDGMMERMLNDDAHFVLDNGATSFLDRAKPVVTLPVRYAQIEAQEWGQTGREIEAAAF